MFIPGEGRGHFGLYVNLSVLPVILETHGKRILLQHNLNILQSEMTAISHDIRRYCMTHTLLAFRIDRLSALIKNECS